MHKTRTSVCRRIMSTALPDAILVSLYPRLTHPAMDELYATPTGSLNTAQRTKAQQGVSVNRSLRTKLMARLKALLRDSSQQDDGNISRLSASRVCRFAYF